MDGPGSGLWGFLALYHRERRSHGLTWSDTNIIPAWNDKFTKSPMLALDDFDCVI